MGKCLQCGGEHDAKDPCHSPPQPVDVWLARNPIKPKLKPKPKAKQGGRNGK